MSKFNEYPALGADLADDDLFLVWKDADGTVRTLAYSDFLAQLEADFSRVDTVDIITSGITLDADSELVVCNSGSPMTITVPLAVSFPGLPVKIFNKGTGDVTLQRSGGDTIAGDTALVLTQYQSVIIGSDGVDMWTTFGAP